jgi:hypothetical protein
MIAENNPKEYKITDTLQKYYDKVFQDGKLVNVHIGMWGMSYSLTENDIKLDNKLPETIKLGKKMLIKPAVFNAFKNYEQRVRNFLYSNSFEFPLVSQAHFVPKSKYMEVYGKLNEMGNKYMGMVDEFIEKYQDYKKEALDYYEQHKDSVNVEHLEEYYPEPGKVRSKFYFDIVSFEITIPAEFKKLDLHDEINREKAAAEAREQALVNYEDQYSKQLDVHMAKISDFVNAATLTLREKITEHCEVALNKINKKEIVSDANIRTLMKHIKEFRELNFVDDKAIEDKLQKVEALLQGDHDFSKDKDALGLLKEHLASVVTEAENLTDLANVSGEYFRKLSV